MVDDQTTESTGTENQAEPTGAENQAQETAEESYELEGGEPESQEQESEPETTTDEKPAPEREINQESVQKRINRAIREKGEADRARVAAEQKAAELEQQLNQRTQHEQAIPDLPDPYDPQYLEKIQARELALTQDATRKAQIEIEQKRQAEEDARRINENVDRMLKDAETHGIKQDDFIEADKTVSLFVRDPVLANFILSQKESALIVRHLADNVQELESLSKMGRLDAVAYIAGEIAPKARGYKPTLPNVPDPLDIPKGRGSAKNEDPAMKGVILE